MNINKRKKLVTVFDLISLSFGLLGTCLGILSILALKTDWAKLTNDGGEINSLIITCVTLGSDLISCIAAFVSFIVGKKIFNSINFDEVDPLKIRLNHHEKDSYEYDKTSFIIGAVGLVLGLASLLTIRPWSVPEASWIITIVAIFADFFSSLMIVFALIQMAKYENVKSIAKLAKQSMRLKEKQKEAK